MARFPVKNRRTQTAEQPWDSTVAKAAPWTPIPSPKMKIGSKMMLTAAPSATVSIPIRPNPWALI